MRSTTQELCQCPVSHGVFVGGVVLVIECCFVEGCVSFVPSSGLDLKKEHVRMIRLL